MNRKGMIIALLTCITMGASGQEQTSMLTEGRWWHYNCHIVAGDIFAPTLTNVFIHGDTIVDGRTCKKLYIESGQDSGFDDYVYEWFTEIGLGGRYHSAWYEDGKKVYQIPKDTTEPVLLFDFGLQVGEKPPYNKNLTYWYDDYITVTGMTDWQDGNPPAEEPHTYRRMRFAEGELTASPKLSDWCQVEGIGGNEGILYTEFQTPPAGESGYVLEWFTECSQYMENRDGIPIYESLFSSGDFLSVATSVKADRYFPSGSSTDSWYDLQGRQVVNPSKDSIKKGIYIREGRKVVVK